MKKKILAVFLSLCMAMSLLPMTVLAAEPASGETCTSGTCNHVAAIGDVHYDTLTDALNAAPNDGTPTEITLLCDYENKGGYTGLSLNGSRNVTLNLNNHTLTLTSKQSVFDQANYQSYSEEATMIIAQSASLTITNGTVTSSVAGNVIVNRGTLKIESSATISNTNNASTTNRHLIDNLGGTVTSAGTLTSTANNGIATFGGTVEITAGSITTEGTNAVCIDISNRSYNNTSAGANVKITGGTLKSGVYVASTNNTSSGGSDGSNLTITGGTLTSGSTTIYWPSSGTLTIGANGSDGPNLTSQKGSAVEICSGTLNLYSGTFQGGTEQTDGDSLETNTSFNIGDKDTTIIDMYRNISGSVGVGDAVTIVSNRADGYVASPLKVNISGGTFNSAKNYGIRYLDCNCADNAEQLTQATSVVLSGGTISGKLGAVDAQFVPETDKNFISGGTFSSDVKDYVATGYAAVKGETDNTWTVGLKTGDGMEAGGTATGTTSTGTVAGSLSADTDKNEGVTNDASNTLTIDVTTGTGEESAPSENTSVTDTTVTIANESLTSVQKATNVIEVSIATDVGTLTLDKDAWGAVTDNANGSPVTLTLMKTAAKAGSPLTYTLTAINAVGNEVYDTENAGGSIKVDVPYSMDTAYVYYLGPNGAEKMVSNVDTEKDRLTWTVNHFSEYAVYSTEQEASVTTSAGKTTCYDTLAAAIAAANDGDTITMLKSITLESGSATQNEAAIVISKSITLDGDGYSITAADNFGNTNMINVTNSGGVTIKDVTINGKNQSRHCINIWSGTNTSEPCNVTLENVKTTGGLTGVTAGGSKVTIQGAQTNIGTGSWNVAVNVDSTDSAKKPASLTVKEGTIGNIYIENSAKVDGTTAEISGGNIQDVVLQNVTSGVKVTITGGTFNDVKEVSKVNDKITEKTPTDMITITGGKFTNPVSAYLADGLVQNADGSVGEPYTPPANPNYKIDIPAFANGTITANPSAAKAGATVTLTATPDEGYAVGTVTVTDRFGDAVRVTENADGTYTFVMPDGQVTVNATFVASEEPAPAEPFTDVDENNWFYDEVVYVYENGLMNGVENNQFAPNTATNRAMLATILYRLAGQPDVSGDLPFTDVAAGTWYTDAVLWAAQNGIVNGIGENQFGPMGTLTREQLVTMLYRYAEAEGYDVSAAADLSGYPDAGEVQTYAQEAMSWAVAEGIVAGMDDGTLNPAGNATRAQIATILMRFCEGVAQ